MRGIINLETTYIEIEGKMGDLNKVQIIGRLGRDPETRYTTGGETISNIAVATSDRWKDKATGEQKEATEWHRITFFGKLAEIVGQYLKKGSQIYVEGKLRTRKYTDKDGIERFTTEIIADQMQMLGGKQEGIASNTAQRTSKPRNDSGMPEDIEDSDIPF